MRSKNKGNVLHPYIHIVPYHLHSIQLDHGNSAKFAYGVNDDGWNETSAEAKHVKVGSEQDGLDHGRSVRVYHDRVAGKVQSAGNANLMNIETCISKVEIKTRVFVNNSSSDAQTKNVYKRSTRT